MKKVFLILVIVIGFVSCVSTPQDIQPYLYGELDSFTRIYYPSTDYKACAIIVTKTGDVYYLRVNAYGVLKDKAKLFNVNEVK